MSLTMVGLLLATITAVTSKNYSAVELNRLRITRRYENHLLTRPSMRNSSQTVVAIGLGIIEVAGIDPQKQVRVMAYVTSLSLSFVHHRSSRSMSTSN